MRSAEIQEKVYDLLKSKNFTAPYGILLSEQRSAAGRPYKSITFGYARTHDFQLQIYNKNFIVFRDSSAYNNQVFKSYEDLIGFLKAL